MIYFRPSWIQTLLHLSQSHQPICNPPPEEEQVLVCESCLSIIPRFLISTKTNFLSQLASFGFYSLLFSNCFSSKSTHAVVICRVGVVVMMMRLARQKCCAANVFILDNDRLPSLMMIMILHPHR
jgi:hypothetical protein